MRMSLAVSPLLAVVALVLTACGTMPLPESNAKTPSPGLWSLAFTGECSGQEAESLRISQLDEDAIAFDEFELRRNDAGEYVGSAIFIAPMPVDGRDIPYEITYALSANDDGGFSGTETIVEGGGHGIACPITLVYEDVEVISSK